MDPDKNLVGKFARRKVAEHDGVNAFLSLLRLGDIEAKGQAALCMADLVYEEDVKETLLNTGNALSWFVELLNADAVDLHMKAAAAAVLSRVSTCGRTVQVEHIRLTLG